MEFFFDDDGSDSGLDADRLDGHDTAYFAAAAAVTALQDQVAALQIQVDALVALLANVTRPDANTIRFSNVDVQIVNGLGSTDTVNGTGNLIVGYNELRGTGDNRSGSHNIVVGKAHNYSSYGGLVVAFQNSITAPWASVTGGAYNQAIGGGCSVSGGSNNQAGAPGVAYSSVSGGSGNEASGNTASIGGGILNKATEFYASVTGGWGNTASGQAASISGGRHNTASGSYSSVAGGGGEYPNYGNKAFADYSTILGGSANTAGDITLNDSNIGRLSAIGGEFGNNASGEYSSFSGGGSNEASCLGSSVAGGGGQQAIDGNIAFADYSAILGGWNNVAGDGGCDYDSSAGRWVSTGGTDHTIGQHATVSGDTINAAQGDTSSVSGGWGRVALGQYDWKAGSLWEDTNPSV